MLYAFHSPHFAASQCIYQRSPMRPLLSRARCSSCCALGDCSLAHRPLLPRPTPTPFQVFFDVAIGGATLAARPALSRRLLARSETTPPLLAPPPFRSLLQASRPAASSLSSSTMSCRRRRRTFARCARARRAWASLASRGVSVVRLRGAAQCHDVARGPPPPPAPPRLASLARQATRTPSSTA